MLLKILAAGAEEDVAGASFVWMEVAGMVVAIVNIFAPGWRGLRWVVRALGCDLTIEHAVGQFVGVFFGLGVNVFAGAQSSDSIFARNCRADLRAGDSDDRLSRTRNDSLFVEFVEYIWQGDHILSHLDHGWNRNGSTIARNPVRMY